MVEQPRLKRYAASNLPAVSIRREQHGLKIRNRSILPDQMPPVTGLGGRRQVAIPERAHRILSNLLRNLGVIDQVINLSR